ncbi:hypothetical protein [Undibacterium sp.]|uniref:hypothetical protein n=1 Tax=Undibacterium sp. TaxID=1914977 RepID=UPI00374DF6D7
MPTIPDTYINALLADASYAIGIHTDDTKGLLAGVLKTRMTENLANYIGDNFKVKDVFNAPDGGFNAVVWEQMHHDTGTRKFYLSIQGTQETQDFVKDSDLAGRGIPYNELKDMINWWLSSTSTGPNVPQIAVQKTSDGDGQSTFTFVAAPSVSGGGKLKDVNTITSVNGHSLAGYLSEAFARLFGAKWPIDAVNTFNGAGFSRLAAANIENEFNNIAQLIGPGLGLGTFPSHKVVESFSQKNPPKKVGSSETRAPIKAGDSFNIQASCRPKARALGNPLWTNPACGKTPPVQSRT